MRAMHPILYERAARRLQTRPFTLRNLVLMMRENKIFAAQVQIETGAENLHAHRAALDVPAGAAIAPRTRPKYLPVLGRARLPEREISDGFFGVIIALHPFAAP